MSEVRPIIIKKKKAGGGDGHHGGAWKVAYADFVTAMMAFFLLMWLLNATSEEQRKGLADFFDPSLPISRVSAGGAGMLNGDTMFSEDGAAGSRNDGVRAKPTNRDPGQDLGERDASPDLAEGDLAPESSGTPEEDAWPSSPNDDAKQGVFGGIDSQDETPSDSDQTGEAPPGTTTGEVGDGEFDGLAEDLLAQMKTAPGDGLLDHFSMRMTPEGLVIEIVDLQGEQLFASGAAVSRPVLQDLMEILVPVLQQARNDIAIAGHTDAAPFARSDYSNWELSADRANTARRMMIQTGLEEDRIARVSGRAATDPIDPDPFASKNRRIAIILLRENSGN